MGRLRVRLGAPERLGGALLLAFVMWAVVAGALSGRVLSPASPYVVAPAALVIGVLTGAFLSQHAGSRCAALGLAVLAGLLLVAVLATAGPAKGPTGYANANAAIAVQLIGLSGLALLTAARRERALLWVAIVLAIGVILANRSVAALAVGVPLLVAVAAMAFRPARRRSFWLLAGLTGAAAIIGGAWTVVILADRASWPGWTVAVLDQARHTMWRDALDLWARHPIAGAGPGAFEQFSRLGHDPDTAAAHSSVLQVGAETGWVGVSIFVLLGVAGLLWTGRGTPAYAVVGAATWTAVVVHSFVDHLVDFPAVVLVAGVALGWSASGGPSEQLHVTEGEGPGRR